MFRLVYLYAIVMAFSLGACSIMRPAAERPAEDYEAREAFFAGDYERAFKLYTQLIEHNSEKGQDVNADYLNRAGFAAYKTGLTVMALEYLERARHTETANDTTYAILAMAYRDIDNLSREITNLEYYLSHYPEAELTGPFRIRYFETLAESQNWQQAFDLWPELDDSVRHEAGLMDMYFKVNVELGHDEAADQIAEELLRLNPNNITALDRMAKKYFHQAEERYLKETSDYERNRTHRQYAQLLEAFEILNKDFRRSLDYFLKLYELAPSREYASYLRNIYSRFNDEERARFYQRQIGD